MIRALIIDDQEINREILKDMINSKLSTRVIVVGEAPNIKKGISLINKLKPELVFLDIEMPGGSGFEMLDKLKEINFAFIITTSHEDFALRAIKFSALDYLLKPVNEAELIKTIDKFINKNKSYNYKNQLEVFLETIRKTSNESNQIGLPTMEGVVWVKLEDIVRCESSVDQTDFYFSDNSCVTVSYPLREVEILLEESNFLRVHDSYIINLQQIKQYYGDGKAVMNDGSQVDISNPKRDEFRKRMAELKMVLN